MLDQDLAELYGVKLSHLHKQVKRNAERFPRSFMFRLNEKEIEMLKKQNIIQKGETKQTLHLAFTEYGVVMLSGILNSETAIQISIQVIKDLGKCGLCY